MLPIAFSVGPFTVYWYGLLMAMAFMSGLVVTYYFARMYGLDIDKLDALVLRLLVAAVIGARLGYVLTRWQYFRHHPQQIIRIDQGGLASHGAILLMIILGYWWTRGLGLPFWRTADAMAPIFPISHVFIRTGNFLNGELYGPPTALPWGVTFPGTTQPHHPTQIYEVLISLGIILLIPRLVRNRRYDGFVFLSLLLIQSLVRFGIDFLRQTTPTIGPLVLTQIVALVLVIGAAGLMWIRARQLQ